MLELHVYTYSLSKGTNVSSCNSSSIDNECSPACQNGGTCVDGVCHCSEQYFGNLCEDESEYTLLDFIY